MLSVAWGQINTDRVLSIGRNALYFEDYVLSIQYFNEVIKVKPYLPEPYLYRSIAKLYLEDFLGADQDATSCIEKNPFIVTAYHVRGIARQNLGEYAAAIADFEYGLTMQPENKAFLRNLAVAYAQKKEYQRADSCFSNLIRLFPSDNAAYLNRAQLRLEQRDSTRALEDLNRAIELDKSSAYAFGLRSMIMMGRQEYEKALEDISMSVLLDPERSVYYINRGLVKYHLHDIRGALSDYDTALELDPHSVISLYNRGLLRAQIGDRNRAIDDFSGVLSLEPDNTFAAYNRALLRDEVGDYYGAIADYTSVYEAHPNFFPALYARAEDYKNLNQQKAADEDFKAAFLLEQKVKGEHEARLKKLAELRAAGVANPDSVLVADAGEDLEPDDEELIRRESDKNIRKFNRVMASNLSEKANTKYGSSIRGRIQDKHFTVKLQDMFVLTYYENSEQIRQGIYFEKTISDFNRSGLLSKRLKVVNDEPMLTQTQVQAHFTSIDDYSRMIGIAPNNIINYFGRALDFMLVQDFQNAIEDLNQVLMRKGNFILAYFNRAVLRLRQLEINERVGQGRTDQNFDELKNMPFVSSEKQPGSHSAKTAAAAQVYNDHVAAQRKIEYEMAMRDFDKVIELSPTFVYAYYNRAYVCCMMNNYEAAIADLNKSIELYPNFAEAYYNRGLIYLKTGHTKAGIADISKAGELGVVDAYSILKRATTD